MPQQSAPSAPSAVNRPTGICSVCHAAPSLISVEANGLASSASTICGGCFARHVGEQRARRVTPVGGFPAYRPPTR